MLPLFRQFLYQNTGVSGQVLYQFIGSFIMKLTRPASGRTSKGKLPRRGRWWPSSIPGRSAGRTICSGRRSTRLPSRASPPTGAQQWRGYRGTIRPSSVSAGCWRHWASHGAWKRKNAAAGVGIIAAVRPGVSNLTVRLFFCLFPAKMALTLFHSLALIKVASEKSVPVDFGARQTTIP
jgi:hypothetical protein